MKLFSILPHIPLQTVPEKYEPSNETASLPTSGPGDYGRIPKWHEVSLNAQICTGLSFCSDRVALIEILTGDVYVSLQVSGVGARGVAGGGRSVPRGIVRGHQPLLHPRQEGHHHATRHVARSKDTRRR